MSATLREMPLRCLIVDDNASFLEDAAALLRREGLVVAGHASNMQDALARARELEPDVALVDISLGAESGFEVARRLAEGAPGGLDVILISTHAESDFVDLIEEAPVAGFLPKSEVSGAAIGRLVR
jgi:two-component system, NarL family, nitrate/nitrite response regulator NarL